MEMTLGSLFDGAGGFPLAGTMAGITPKWASEIEPFPIRVTTRRLPGMRHIGDITGIDGGEVEPVDIITFGSPCQNLSVAGNREGLQGERSGLFHEAIRVIREMREKTHGQKPRFIVWENVPGAFSSNGGEDFRTVLEEIAKVKDPGVHIPRPENGRWGGAGEIMADGYSIAWRVVDAQFWGVPQRRKRIYLVADLRGDRAGAIQFERDRVCGNPPEGEGAGQTAATAAGGSPAEPGEPGVAAFIAGNSAKARGIGYSETVCPTLKSEAGGNTVPCAMAFHLTQDPITFEDTSPCISTGNARNGQATVGALIPVAYGLVSKASNAWKSSNPHSGCYETETARTLDTHGGDATCNQGGNLIICPATVYENHGQDTRFRPTGDIAQTVVEKYGTGGGNQPLVVQPAWGIGRDYITVEAETAQTLTRSDVPGMIAQPYTIGNGQVHDFTLDEKARTLNCMHDAQAAIVPQETGGYPYIVRWLMPLECSRLQGYPDWWAADLDTPNPTEDEISWWLEVFETHRKAVKPDTKPKTRNQVRKWLQHPHSDSAEYKMWGNSLAIPNAFHVLAGIAEELQKPDEDEWMQMAREYRKNPTEELRCRMNRLANGACRKKAEPSPFRAQGQKAKEEYAQITIFDYLKGKQEQEE